MAVLTAKGPSPLLPNPKASRKQQNLLKNLETTIEIGDSDPTGLTSVAPGPLHLAPKAKMEANSSIDLTKPLGPTIALNGLIKALMTSLSNRANHRGKTGQTRLNHKKDSRPNHKTTPAPKNLKQMAMAQIHLRTTQHGPIVTSAADSLRP